MVLRKHAGCYKTLLDKIYTKPKMYRPTFF